MVRIYNRRPEEIFEYLKWASELYSELYELGTKVHPEEAPKYYSLAKALVPEVYISRYHEFLSNCLKEKAKEKGDKLTLAETQKNFRQCNLEWKKLKEKEGAKSS